MSGRGYSVVLTADRTLMARHDVLLDGMMAASQTTTTPWLIMDRLLLRRVPHPGGRCRTAPLGLRRVEAALLEGGCDAADVAVVDDAHLDAVVGPATRIIAVSSGETCGRGMSSSTMAAIAGGAIYPQVLFERLMGRIDRLRAARCPRARVVAGGPGAWQLAEDAYTRATLGVDHVVCGYCEKTVAQTFHALLASQELPAVIHGGVTSASDIPRLRGATTMGAVEISRGCGLGCGFCTLAAVPMTHLSVEHILNDVETNLTAGIPAAIILSEDTFRYGGHGVQCAPEALIGLLRGLRSLPRLRLIQTDHVNVASVAQFPDDALKEVCALLQGERAARRPWVNLGVETPCGELLAANGGQAKMGGSRGEDWGDLCRDQIQRLCKAGFMPMISLLVALPGETAEHVHASLEWVRSINSLPMTVFPVLYAPIDGSPPPAPSRLTRLHWQLMREAYELNFRNVPRMYWEDQSGVGVGLGRRMMLQALGKAQALLWRRHLAEHYRRADA